MKKAIICFLVAAMIMSFGITANAAEVSQPAKTAVLETYQASSNYALYIEDDTLEFFQNDEVVSSEDLADMNVTLTRSADDGIAIQFNDANGELRKITLGSQTSVAIGGNITSLTLSSSLQSNTKVTIASDGYVKKMTVNSPNKVTVNGTVNNMSITNSKARVTASEEDSIAKVTTVSRAAVDGVPSKKVSVKSTVTNTGSSVNSNGSYYYNGRYYDTYADWYDAKYGRYYDGSRYYYNGKYYNNYDDYYYARFGGYYTSADDYYKDGKYYFDGRTYDNFEDYYYAKYGVAYDGSNDNYYYTNGRARRYYADGSYADRYYYGTDFFVSVVKVSDDNTTITFKCDLSGADVYWNDEYIGRTNNGNNEFTVDVKSTNHLVIEKEGRGGKAVTVYGN